MTYEWSGGGKPAEVKIVEPKCSLCWSFLYCYPTLKGMDPHDEAMFVIHLEKHHGWKRGDVGE